MKLSVTAILILANIGIAFCADKEWSAGTYKGKTTIAYRHDSKAESPPNYQGLKPLLASIDRELPIKHVSFWDYLSQDPVVQSELLEVFQKDHPIILNEALKSAGNMHNPKVLPLRKHFSEALSKTATFKSIDTIFREHGYVISDVSFEKFWIDKKGKAPKFHSIVWLIISPKAEKVDAPQTEIAR